jgi:hypothetical protein
MIGHPSSQELAGWARQIGRWLESRRRRNGSKELRLLWRLVAGGRRASDEDCDSRE